MPRIPPFVSVSGLRGLSGSLTLGITVLLIDLSIRFNDRFSLYSILLH